MALDVLDSYDYLIGLRRVMEVRRALPVTVATAALSRLDRRLSTWDAMLEENGRHGAKTDQPGREAGTDPTVRAPLGG